jgi:hypothetical protein
VKFRLGHCALQPEQKLIVKLVQVVDTIGIHDQSVCDATKFQEALEVRGTPGQTRNFESKDGSNAAQANAADELLETEASRVYSTRNTEVGIDDRDLGTLPPEPRSFLRECVLTRRGLLVLADLYLCRLAEVDKSQPFEMLFRDLGRADHRSFLPHGS